MTQMTASKSTATLSQCYVAQYIYQLGSLTAPTTAAVLDSNFYATTVNMIAVSSGSGWLHLRYAASGQFGL